MQNEVDFFKAFGNITRVKIIACLGEASKNVTGLIQNCDLSQSAVSQHLMLLRALGIVTVKRQGREQQYSLVFPELSPIAHSLLKSYLNYQHKI